MKKKLNLWLIISLGIDAIGAALLILCITTDINDELFLPLALGSILAANVVQMVVNAKYIKRKK